MSGGEISSRAIHVTWLALMVLAATSLALRFAHLGALGLVVALGIATAKASLVALFFMELAIEKATVRFAFLAGLALLAVLLSLMLADVVTRAAMI